VCAGDGNSLKVGGQTLPSFPFLLSDTFPSQPSHPIPSFSNPLSIHPSLVISPLPFTFLPSNPAIGGLGSGKLPQRGLGQSPGRKRILAHLEVVKLIW